jgi:hypothetical protein
MLDRLRFYQAQAEEAYVRMYEARIGSDVAGCYSDAKESLHEAIALAQRLGLWSASRRLSARLDEIKTVFRRQFPA